MDEQEQAQWQQRAHRQRSERATKWQIGSDDLAVIERLAGKRRYQHQIMTLLANRHGGKCWHIAMRAIDQARKG